MQNAYLNFKHFAQLGWLGWLIWATPTWAATTKVAAISFSPPEDAPVEVSQATVDAYKNRTAQALENLIREAARGGAKLIVTPEFSTVGYPDIPDLPPEEDEFLSRDHIRPYVEELAGKTVQRFSKVASELKVWLVIGFAEVEPSTDKYYNTLAAINPSGKVAQTYRKIHLFEGETKFLSAGSRRAYFDTEFGRVGLFTCYDIHFAEPATNLVSKDKAQIIAFGTSWVGDDGMSTFRDFAKENSVYFIAANHTYFPDSGVISPSGKVQSHIQNSGVALGEIATKRRGGR